MVDNNSLLSYIEEKESGNIGRRASEIYEIVKNNKGLTAREIMILGCYPEPNCVKPRLTELCNKGLIRKGDKARCQYTNKTVWTYVAYYRNKEND